MPIAGLNQLGGNGLNVNQWRTGGNYPGVQSNIFSQMQPSLTQQASQWYPWQGQLPQGQQQQPVTPFGNIKPNETRKYSPAAIANNENAQPQMMGYQDAAQNLQLMLANEPDFVRNLQLLLANEPNYNPNQQQNPQLMLPNEPSITPAAAGANQIPLEPQFFPTGPTGVWSTPALTQNPYSIVPVPATDPASLAETDQGLVDPSGRLVVKGGRYNPQGQPVNKYGQRVVEVSPGNWTLLDTAMVGWSQPQITRQTGPGYRETADGTRYYVDAQGKRWATDPAESREMAKRGQLTDPTSIANLEAGTGLFVPKYRYYNPQKKRWMLSTSEVDPYYWKTPEMAAHIDALDRQDPSQAARYGGNGSLY
jgi:hypothetical protein